MSSMKTQAQALMEDGLAARVVELIDTCEASAGKKVFFIFNKKFYV